MTVPPERQATATEPSVSRRIRIQSDASAVRKPQDNGDARRAVALEPVFDVNDVSIFYGPKRAVQHVSLQIYRTMATAIIGPSGCGKTTFLRCLNRMNDTIPGFKIEGQLRYHGHDVYGSRVNRVEVRRRIGMVFQKPNPFAKSIYDNVAWAPRNLGMRRDLNARVERALRDAALWDEVKDRLKSSALGLSGGQQQRLCIARAIAVEPDVLLLDEPASALDPIATIAIEDLITVLKRRYTIVIVTHNMQQAARVADKTAFFSLDSERIGTLIEYDDTERIFTNPRDPRTQDYVTGRFG
jgi:phosphate transport system ATP-binding protein